MMAARSLNIIIIGITLTAVVAFFRGERCLISPFNTQKSLWNYAVHSKAPYLQLSSSGIANDDYGRIDKPLSSLPSRDKVEGDENLSTDQEVLELPFLSNLESQVGTRESDLFQNRDLDLILTERATRFYDPKLVGVEKEKCILVAVDKKLDERRANAHALVADATPIFTMKESLSELSELVGTAGMQVMGTCVQRLYSANGRTYVGSGKVVEIMESVNATGARTIVVDDDLTPKQQRNLEDALVPYGGVNVKVLDRTAVILEIFAQHAKSREGQLQVELAMLEYRLTRGPRASGGDGDSGCGFRGPGETKLETDKRVIKDKIVLLQREIAALGMQREQHRKSRMRLGLPVVALVGYTNAGKSTLLNRLSRAGVLAENMLFATLDPTTRRVQLPRSSSKAKNSILGQNGQAEDDVVEASSHGIRNKGQEVLLTDTVGFISKLPTDLIAAFRATLEEVAQADVLVHVIDRSSPVWQKHRETVLRELDSIGCEVTPIVELWNKIDNMEEPDDVRMEAMCTPVDVAAVVRDSQHVDDESSPNALTRTSTVDFTDVTNEDIPTVSSTTGRTKIIGGSDDGKTANIEHEDFGWDKESWTKPSRDKKLARNSVAAEEDLYTWMDDDEYVREGMSPDSQDNDVSSKRDISSSYTSSAPVSSTAIEHVNVDASTQIRAGRPVRERFRPDRKIFTVAASARTGLGFDDFLETLESALSLLLKPIEVFVPFSQDDGIIASIHSQGVVDSVDYNNIGTILKCRVPPALYARLQKYRVAKKSASNGLTE